MLSSLLLTLASQVFVGGAEAEKLLDRGAVVLDARGDKAEPPYLPTARAIEWTSMRDGMGRTGRLDDDHTRLKRKLEALGVSSQRPVLVYGAMRQGWGEEGRVWWMLRYLGHEDVHILDGGIELWVKEGRRTEKIPDRSLPKPGTGLTIKPVAKLRADWREVDKARRTKGQHVLDVRTDEEWKGAQRYLESRGGHVPGAQHFEWLSFIGPDGKILPKDQVLERLKTLDIDEKSKVITYCTGGVRAAFVVAVLTHYGIGDVANYDGSWFDWSARAQLPVE